MSPEGNICAIQMRQNKGSRWWKAEKYKQVKFYEEQ